MEKNKEKMFKKLGKIFQRARKTKYKDVSLRKFSDSIGMTHAGIKNIENGKGEPRKETLLKLAEKLELDPEVILAKAAKLDNEIENLISEKSDTVPQFLRTAKNLTDEQWKEITRQARKMDKDNS